MFRSTADFGEPTYLLKVVSMDDPTDTVSIPRTSCSNIEDMYTYLGTYESMKVRVLITCNSRTSSRAPLVRNSYQTWLSEVVKNCSFAWFCFSYIGFVEMRLIMTKHV